MAKKKQAKEEKKVNLDGVVGLVGSTTEQAVSETLEVNYMPYAMSVIVSRAIPEIDGFKPSHRKLLYTMYKMGLLTGGRTKSANIVGQTMRLNPHGDAAIYETMVRLARGNETLLHPFVDSKGNFGKVYSRDMAYAASRYTEAKLDPICAELFRDIDADTVDMVDNYDATMKEPSLLPTTFPNVLVSANQGIAVGMASNICSFNLKEVCETAIALMKNPDHDILETLPGPDFSTGAQLLYDEAATREIYSTGRGSFRLRSKWRYVKEGNLIEITEIPYSTATEVIMDKVAELIKAGKIREIADMRDETDLGGLKLTIDLKRGVDPDKLMQKLFRMTPLQDSFPCNFNILIAGMPRVMGIGEILDEWTAWRMDCVKRRLYFQVQKKQERLHLLKGLERILLDIDKAITIIRETELDSEVVPNLMIGFGIDEIQANFVAEIKLRNINKEYILKQTKAASQLEQEIAELQDTLNSQRKLKNVIIKELQQVAEKYGQPRKTEILYNVEEVEPDSDEDETPDYPVTVFVSREGYLKKITAQSLRMSGEQKFKEGDTLAYSVEATNKAEMLVFTDKFQCYKTRLSDFEDGKASLLGDYLPQKLGMDAGENVLQIIFPGDGKGFVLFFFENGKVAKVPLSAYETKTNRKKLTGAFSDKSPAVKILSLAADTQIAMYSSDGRAMIFSTADLLPKTTRNTIGVAVMSLKKKAVLQNALLLEESGIENQSRYRMKTIPAAGALLREEDSREKQAAFEI
ncbi:topoisomerase IV [Pseudoflavonifractor sp. MSJ-30]|uniref:DNA gyrase/topoisomerase IV subunit A n=1 Tax=Pseudoflavonifractor sp. MSJ-30 TaxID=2841525 RepID=UPI001C10F170|nr:DNA topoisomerase (ATP-hydrolyzing) subunit A [Pseudoflavonifractor sp. MSJ-30]MBU5452001.1 topoisomerase IV [Pseudoflavonifractor sp. MSJ-30]